MNVWYKKLLHKLGFHYDGWVDWNCPLCPIQSSWNEKNAEKKSEKYGP